MFLTIILCYVSYDAVPIPLGDILAPVGVTQTVNFEQFAVHVVFFEHGLLVVHVYEIFPEFLEQLHVPKVETLSGVVKNVIIYPPSKFLSAI